MARGRTRLSTPTSLISLGGVALAALTGAALSQDIALGLALVGACVMLPLVALNLPVALAAWIPLGWNEYSHVGGKAPLAGLLLLVLAWLGTHRLRGKVAPAEPCIRTARIGLALLLVWVTLSISWADDRADAWTGTLQWYLAAAVFLLVTTVATTPARARLVALAFVAGGLMSIAIGLTGTGLSTTATSIDLATRARFAGGAGDPNYLAAGLVAAVSLSFGLMASTRSPLGRLGLLGTIVAFVAALVATESRGGLIAALVAFLVALGIARRHRAQALLLTLAAVAAVAGIAIVAPAGVGRLTTFDAGGTGRTELWQIATRMSSEHRLAGVGINGFPHESKDYVQQPGALAYVRNVVDRPLVAHDVYLQQLAETGVVGLVLLVAVLVACIVASCLAASRFAAQGDGPMAGLARATTVGIVGMLVASTFISNGTDKRLWLVLALGPALLAAAGTSRSQPSSTSR